MNILYCGDEGISRGVLVSVLSLMKNCKEPLEIYIMTIKYEGVRPFKKKTVEFLDKLVKGKVQESGEADKKIYFLDVPDLSGKKKETICK